MNRPLIWVALPFLGGLVLGAANALPEIFFWVLGAAAGAAIWFFAGPSDRLVRLACVLLFGSAGGLYWTARHLEPTGDALLDLAIQRPDNLVELEGRVERPDILLRELGYGQFTIRVERWREANAREWTNQTAGVLVRWDDPSVVLFAGDTVRTTGRLEYGLSVVNPDVSSYEDYLRRRDIHTRLRLFGETNISKVEEGAGWRPAYWASRFRYEQARRLTAVLPAETIPFVLTVWLGERRLIEDTEYQAFVESGTAHILAVSGVHTGIVYVSAEFLLLFLLRDYKHRRLRRILVLNAVVVFALVAGARISSLRAATMIALYVLAQIFDRDPDAPTALSFSALIFTLHDPDVIFDPGFILSFSAIASLLMFTDPISQWLERLPRPLRPGLSVALAVQVLPLPFAAAIFNIVPILGVLANLIVVPLLTVALWLSLLTAVAAFISSTLATILGHALYPVVAIIDGTAQIVASLPGSFLEVSKPTIPAVVLFVAGALALHRAISGEKVHRTILGCAIAAFGLSAAIWGYRPAVDEVVFLDVGQGDATVIRTQEGGVMVVDAGDRIGSVDYGQRSVAAYLRAQGVSRIDLLVGTHADKDHQGGLEYLVRHFDVGTLYFTYVDTGDAIEQSLEDICTSRGIPSIRIAAGERLPLAGASVLAIHPPDAWGADVADNERSVVLKIELAGRSFLLTGDIESAGEAELLSQDVGAAVLKVPHHGSRTSSTPVFVDAVDPDFAVVSTGRQGRKRILSEAVLDGYVARGVEVLRTDYRGGIRFRFDGDWRVETGRGQRDYRHPVEDGAASEN